MKTFFAVLMYLAAGIGAASAMMEGPCKTLLWSKSTQQATFVLIVIIWPLEAAPRIGQAAIDPTLALVPTKCPWENRQ